MRLKMYKIIEISTVYAPMFLFIIFERREGWLTSDRSNKFDIDLHSINKYLDSYQIDNH